MNKRDKVRNARARAAEELAARKGEVTPEAIEEAAWILQKCIRLALAYQRHKENESERTFKQSWFIHEEELLEARWHRLNNELRPYGAALYCAGYLCVDVYGFDFERHVINSNGFLHFF